MKLKTIVRRARKLAKRYRISDGSGFQLKDIDPSDTGKLEREDKAIAQELLTTGIQALAELQERLYAQDRWAVLLVFQAIDAAGKDSAIKHVMSGVNPQGCQVYSFGVPSAHDLDHDYLWRCLSVLPERGRIGIFNRSYYEEVIVVRVHPEFLARQKVPAALLNDKNCGHTDSRTSATSSSISRATACSSGSSSCTSRKRNRKNGFSSGSKSPKRIGNSTPRISRNASAGTIIRRRTKDDSRYCHKACAVVRRPGRPQVVHAAGRGIRDHRRVGRARFEISRGHVSTKARDSPGPPASRRPLTALSADAARFLRTTFPSAHRQGAAGVVLGGQNQDITLNLPVAGSAHVERAWSGLGRLSR